MHVRFTLVQYGGFLPRKSNKTTMNGFVDLHCHILPGVDDGPGTVEDAVALVLGLEDLGFSDLYPTPHQKPGSWMPTSEETMAAAEQLRDALKKTSSGVTVHDPAGENMWSDRLLASAQGGFPCYPGGEAFLLEFTPFAVPNHLRDHFYEFNRQGQLPVVAHVERYEHITADMERLDAIGANAALLVNLASLVGWWNSRDARKLVSQGWVHAAASDAHSSADLDLCRRGIEWLGARLGQPTLERLLRDNPRQIIEGQLPEAWR